MSCPKDLYEPRAVDEELQEAALNWLSPASRVRWVSLKTKPGKGNSELLRHFHDWLKAYEAGFQDIKVITVHGDSTHYPATAGPLTSKVAHLYHEVRRSRVQKIMHLVRTAPLHRKAIACLILLGSGVLACLVVGASEYNKLPEATWTINVGQWTSGFVFKFLPVVWYKLPVWLFTEYLLEVTLPFGVACFVGFLASGRLREVGPSRVSRKELKDLKSPRKLANALLAVSHKCRGIILLVDDAQWLPDEEKQRLADLVALPAGAAELEAFAAKRRVLVVTVESVETHWPERPEGAIRTLEVTDFTPEALSRMAWTQLKDGDFGRLEESKREALLHEARGNINALFAERVRAYDKVIGKRFDEALDEGFADGFDLKDLMAYWALSHASSVTKSEMRDWLEALCGGEHLKDFGLKPPDNVLQLAKEFDKTSLARREGKVYFLDMARCRALLRWLGHKEGPDGETSRRLLARAHYFWFRHLTGWAASSHAGPASAAAMTDDERQAIKEAAWHAVRIGIQLERVADVLADASGLSADERNERRYHVAETLLCAAAVCRGEGNTTEANDLIVDALDWLPEADGARRRAALERGAQQLWQNFWLSGSPASITHLRELLKRNRVLRESASWRVNRRHVRLLRCRLPLKPAPDEAQLSGELLDLHRLTETLLDIRLSHGMLAPALADPDVEIREPAACLGENLHETQLRHLQVAALAARDGSAAARAAVLGDWRARLQGAEDGRLGDEALRCYHRALYLHTLADLCRAGAARIEDDEDILLVEEGAARGELYQRARAFCLTPPPEGVPLPLHLWREAQAAYVRARRLASFIYWQPLVMEVCFREGELLREHTPEDQRKPSSDGKPWWRHWDRLFWQALNLEREFDWVANAPAMHRIRWEFFSAREDNERSVVDAYNSLQTAKRAKYPPRLTLDWHKQVSAQLTNHSDSDEDRQRDAELHEEWADRLAALPEAREHWGYETLDLERAHALLFAAQARRLLRDLENADKLLDRAEALVGAPPASGDSNGHEPKKVRDMHISLKVQRAWLRQAQERKNDYKRSIREIWSEIRREDEDTAILLATLLNIEHEEKLLGDPWPPPGFEPHEDPDSPVLSLPASWFRGAFPLRLKNRFEFRFYQLLSLANYLERIERFSAKVGLETMPSVLGLLNLAMRRARAGAGPDAAAAAGPELLFQTQMLKNMAQLGWLGTNKFAETSQTFAEYGRVYNHTAETRERIVSLLEAVRFYFAEVEKVDREELETLRLLMDYEPDSPKNYRLEYVRVLCQQRYMDWHEGLSLDAAAKDWYDAAQKMHKYLYVLVDEGLWSSGIRMELQRLGVSERDFEAQHARRGAVLREAFEKYERGDRAGCFVALQNHLPETCPWVFMEDLKMLNLWLKCAPREGAEALDAQRRSAQLRALARQYIRQFRVGIKEEEVHPLIAGVVGGLQNAVD